MRIVLNALISMPQNYLGLAALIYNILLCCFIIGKSNTSYQSRRFGLFAFIVTGATLLEILRPAMGALPDNELTYFLKRFVQSLNWIASTGMSFSFVWYLDSFFKSNSRLRVVFGKINLVLYLTFILVCIINTWTAWIAGYDTATGIWVHGPLYPYAYFPAVYMLVYALVFFLRDIRKLDKLVVRAMIISILIAIVSVATQPLLHDQVRLMVLGVSIALYLWYFSVETFDTQRLITLTKELQTAEQKALEASLAKNAFLANMSHEIRTPLNAVLGLDEMILKSNDKAEIDEYAHTIQAAGKSLLSIINDILDFSKIETGRLEFVQEQYHLGSLLDDINSLMAVRASQKNLDWRVKIDETLPDCLIGDEMRVRQIMLNLLNNAIKYTKTGYVQFAVTGVPKENSVVLKISVKDSGVGIREEDKKNLFKSFERLDETRHHSVEGAGLGLAIVHQLLELMGGDVSVESEYGKGSTFTVLLPQEISGNESITQARIKLSDEVKIDDDTLIVAPEAKVLIVDDNRVNLMVAKGLLKDTQVQVTTCESGRECLNLMQAHRYDIIFLDHMMPEMDGLETFKKSQDLEGNLNAGVPVVVFTANAMAGMKEQYLAVGFTDYISKPIDGKRFKQVLFKYIPKDLKNYVESQTEEPVELEELPQEDTVLTLDQQSGMEMCGGTKEVYMSVLSLFCEEKKETKPKLENFYANEDWKNYGILAHALKSNSKLVGCAEFADFALQMERSCEGDATFVRQNHAEFMQMYDNLEDVIKIKLTSL